MLVAPQERLFAQTRVEPEPESSYDKLMPLTLEQIVEETRHWPPARLAELVDSLTLELHRATPPEVETAWKQEARRRLAEIENGSVQPLDGQEVSARVRRIVGR
jgi:hypothetical protein